MFPHESPFHHSGQGIQSTAVQPKQPGPTDGTLTCLLASTSCSIALLAMLLVQPLCMSDTARFVLKPWAMPWWGMCLEAPTSCVWEERCPFQPTVTLLLPRAAPAACCTVLYPKRSQGAATTSRRAPRPRVAGRRDHECTPRPRHTLDTRCRLRLQRSRPRPSPMVPTKPMGRYQG